MQKLGLIGAGGHAKVVGDIIATRSDLELVAIFDDKYEMVLEEKGILYAPISYILKFMENTPIRLIVAIGNNKVRRMIVDRLQLSVTAYETIIHPSAIISPSAMIGGGTVIMPASVINAGTIIGEHVIVNTASVIEHDNNIGDYAHISPKATLTGNVTVGSGTQVGAGATIIPGVTIGEWSIVGAGSTVISNIPSHCTAVGSPTKILKQ